MKIRQITTERTIEEGRQISDLLVGSVYLALPTTILKVDQHNDTTDKPAHRVCNGYWIY